MDLAKYRYAFLIRIMFIIPQWRNCSVDCERCSLQETHIISTTDKDILSVHTKERLLTGITAPAGAPKSISKTWLMESWPFTAQLPTGRVPPPPDRLSSIRQAPLSLVFCDAVGWNLQFTVHLPVTFYTSLVTELLFFLGCLDDLVKGPCERVAVTYWCVVKEIQTEVLCAGWIRSKHISNASVDGKYWGWRSCREDAEKPAPCWYVEIKALVPAEH